LVGVVPAGPFTEEIVMGEAMEKFEPDHSRTLTYHEGDYVAHVAFIAGSWSYTVFHGGQAVTGERSWNMHAGQACDRAFAAIQNRKQGLDPASRF
jgi:hypothetical protein